MTKLEKIQNMTAEEMAEMFSEITGTIALRFGNDYVVRDKKFLIEFLESEVE